MHACILVHTCARTATHMRMHMFKLPMCAPSNAAGAARLGRGAEHRAVAPCKLRQAWVQLCQGGGFVRPW